MASSSVKVKGLRELNRAFTVMGRDVKKELTGELKKVGEPVRRKAEQRSAKLGPAWSRIKVGSRTSAVYVAPAARRHGGSPRPNAGRILLHGMLTARDEERDRTIDALDKMLGRLGGDAGF